MRRRESPGSAHREGRQVDAHDDFAAAIRGGLVLDPQVPTQRRYWDGHTWTEHVESGSPSPSPSPNALQQPASVAQDASAGHSVPPPGGPPPSVSALSYSGPTSKPTATQWWKRPWAIALGALLAVLFIAIAANPGTSTKPTGGASDQPAAKQNEDSSGANSSPSSGKDCTVEATADCTPDVASNGQVKVDALVWQVPRAQTASTIGDTTYGLGAKANGVFVIVDLALRSDKDESATLTDKVVQLEGADGTRYDPDSDGTVVAIGDGQDPLFLEDISPNNSSRSKVVFDVPMSLLGSPVKVRFNELGFGSTHGYIGLPTLG